MDCKVSQKKCSRTMAIMVVGWLWTPRSSAMVCRGCWGARSRPAESCPAAGCRKVQWCGQRPMPCVGQHTRAVSNSAVLPALQVLSKPSSGSSECCLPAAQLPGQSEAAAAGGEMTWRQQKHVTEKTMALNQPARWHTGGLLAESTGQLWMMLAHGHPGARPSMQAVHPKTLTMLCRFTAETTTSHQGELGCS